MPHRTEKSKLHFTRCQRELAHRAELTIALNFACPISRSARTEMTKGTASLLCAQLGKKPLLSCVGIRDTMRCTKHSM
jgi:hypothetical protein